MITGTVRERSDGHKYVTVPKNNDEIVEGDQVQIKPVKEMDTDELAEMIVEESKGVMSHRPEKEEGEPTISKDEALQVLEDLKEEEE